MRTRCFTPARRRADGAMARPAPGRKEDYRMLALSGTVAQAAGRKGRFERVLTAVKRLFGRGAR